MNYPVAIISRKVEDDFFYQRAGDGFINATGLCKASGKKYNDYARLDKTKAFLSELSKETGQPVSELIQIVKGGYPELQGTWVHIDVAVNLAQWCSPKFAVAVSKWVREWLTGKAKASTLPYHLERALANFGKVSPTTHFSILNEMIMLLIAPLETLGYILPDTLVPDISEGRMFCKWLRDEKGIDTDALETYEHVWADGRVVYPKMYPIEILGDFRKHFIFKWLPERAVQYFSERDPKVINLLPKVLKIAKGQPRRYIAA